MVSHRLSEQGHLRVKQARKHRGWIIEDAQWLIEASKILDPNRLWTEQGPFAKGISLPTWKNFLQGNAIRPPAFKAFCQILNLNWQLVYENEGCDEPILTPFEVLREPQESLCCETILQPGSLVRIKAPQYMGKTEMLNRVLRRVEQNQREAQKVVINFYSELERTSFANLDTLLHDLCTCVSNELELPDNLHDCWMGNGTPNLKTSNYFEDYIFPNINNSLILVLEGIDRAFEYSFATDFCNLLRSWHGEGQRDEQWKKLRLVIVHSTDKYASLDIDESPLYNVGVTVTLDEFTFPQVESLVNQYGFGWNSDQINQLMALVGGNPYLINHALRMINDHSMSLEEVLNTASKEEGIYRDRLRYLWKKISSQPMLKEALRRVISAQRIDPVQIYKLDSLGLVRIEGNNVMFRCNLYHQYFSTLLAEGEST
jgi:AAA-like domain